MCKKTCSTNLTFRETPLNLECLWQTKPAKENARGIVEKARPDVIEATLVRILVGNVTKEPK